MLLNLIFPLLLSPTNSWACKNSFKTAEDITTCLVSKTNYEITTYQASIPCNLINYHKFHDITVKVPSQYSDTIPFYLKNQIYLFIKTYKPEELRKLDYLLEQLETKYPSQIPFFMNLEETVQSQEKVEHFIHTWCPLLSGFYQFWKGDTTFENEYFYHYAPLFRSYHDFFECSKTGKPFLIKGKILLNNETLITKIASADEYLDEKLKRNINIIYFITGNVQSAIMKYGDILKVLSSSCLEFDEAIQKLIDGENDIDNLVIYNKVRSDVENEVRKFISKNIGNQEYVNLYGIYVPAVMKVFETPIGHDGLGQLIECYYLNQEQLMIVKQKLKNTKSKVLNSIFALIDCLNYINMFYNKFSINSLMFSAIPGGINKIVSIFNPTVTPMWNDMKHKASGLLSKIGINIENDEDKKFFEKMEKQKNQEKERHILKNSLDDIVDYNRSYLVKIKYSQGGYEPDGILFFL
ncbi:hypothetical protein M9Y10_025115 [Tritrichomonas musculus]|uniref:Uncharacterized protein n=1 Tax=Tritrichomonas musculus TaxID=1915356 RepID=A0ABR2HAI7_9EUKA